MTDQTQETGSARPTVAVLGTGIMGSGMARSAVRAGLPVRVWNRSRERAEPLAADGATVCDSPSQAVTGADVVLAAGPQDLRATCQPVFDAIGSRTVWQDEVGQGTRLKLACNDLVLTLVEGIAESLTLAGALGVDPHLVLEAVRGGAMGSPYVQLKGTAMLDDALDEPAFPLSGAAKDAGLIVDAARSVGVELAVAAAVHRRMELAAEQGQGGADLAATYRASRATG